MNLTKELKDWAVENLKVSADASDEDFRKAIAEAITDGTLSPEKLRELTTTKSQKVEDFIRSQISESVGPIADAVKELKDALAAKGDDEGGDKGKDKDKSSDATPDIEKLIGDAVQKAMATNGNGNGGTRSPADLIAGSKGTVELKKAVDRYDQTKSAAIYPAKSMMAGQPATYMDRPLNHPSQADKAINGAIYKWLVNAGSNGFNLPRQYQLNEHESELVKYAIHELPWSGDINGGRGNGGWTVNNEKLSDTQVKALLDDATSGGLEAAPILFDDAVILTPVLHGELFPQVNLINISRGRRVEAFSMGNPTFAWGAYESGGTAIPLFDTTAFIAALDTTIFEAVGSMEVGLDFEEDSPVNIGQTIAQQYGQKAMETLDEQIAIGDGTSEPLGIFNTTGTTVVSSANGTSGPLTVGDAEQLLFGVPKEFRMSRGGRNCFVMNETTYRRFRAVAVGTSDQRRVFGMDHETFTLLGFPVKIQAQISDNDIAFVNLGFYRMYRRLGLQVRVETGGKELARANNKLIVVRMRYGGQIELGSAVAEINDGPVVD